MFAFTQKKINVEAKLMISKLMIIFSNFWMIFSQLIPFFRYIKLYIPILKSRSSKITKIRITITIIEVVRE